MPVIITADGTYTPCEDCNAGCCTIKDCEVYKNLKLLGRSE